MRGYFLLMIAIPWIAFALFKPHVGVLIWNWFSHMNPHLEVAGWVRTFPFLDGVAACTIVGMLIGRDKKSFPSHPIMLALVLYLIWVLFTTVAAFNVDLAILKLIHFLKVLLFAFVAIIVMQSPMRLKAFVWVMALSLAYVSVKGGLFTILTGGGARVQGAGGMIEDNNQLAMALSMFLPVAYWHFQHPPHKLLKWPMLGATALTAISILGTQSRGGFVAFAAVMAMTLLKSKRKFAYIALVVPLVIGAITFMPDSWKERIQSTENATEDDSFVGRVSMWKFSTNLAGDNFLEGGGFDVFYDEKARELYMPDGFEPRAPHSIYFEVLAEHGYIGLILFLTILFTGWYSAGSAAKRFQSYDQTKWLADLCTAIQLSLVGYAVGGLTVNIATFDFFYHLLAVIVMANVVGEKIIIKGVTVDGQDANVTTILEKWSPTRQSQKHT
ncbi:putative O-glycosylation ligase, exosortase A system-associated [Kordiimonas sp. SCSIO 12610]|uniref:putative O-glycosylation ligase, exosortase A system-associated n=1 Tax=Kordiimonas sp. SCSIO 12610 TaxID=2829597 RepID=UPI002109D44F|nr:putative O-glycosylation ligase, exosortase A system-associated [Kordiimonas sp. SCSIO 12610]UTW55114.1 putative O-glycosylation ligase, exosortase A system-associated [Kordiimonas sp. SCSIO 12610]